VSLQNLRRIEELEKKFQKHEKRIQQLEGIEPDSNKQTNIEIPTWTREEDLKLKGMCYECVSLNTMLGE
jgi:hypothetical protein